MVLREIVGFSDMTDAPCEHRQRLGKPNGFSRIEDAAAIYGNEAEGSGRCRFFRIDTGAHECCPSGRHPLHAHSFKAAWTHGGEVAPPWLRICRSSCLALVASKQRVEVLTQPRDRACPHILVGPTGQKLFNSFGYVVSQSGSCARLKERKFVETVIGIVQHNVARCVKMVPQPAPEFVASGSSRHVRADIVEWNLMICRCQKPDGVNPPGRGEDDRRAGRLHKIAESAKQTVVYNIRKMPRIRGCVAIKYAVNI